MQLVTMRSYWIRADPKSIEYVFIRRSRKDRHAGKKAL